MTAVLNISCGRTMFPGLQMWMQTLVPGTAIPPHTHGGEEVVIALKVSCSKHTAILMTITISVHPS